MLLALEALPDPTADVRRPYLRDAELALVGARAHLREIGSINYGAHVLELNADWSKAITYDGQHAPGEHAAGVWELKTGTQMLRLPHAARVNSAMLSPDGRRIVTASQDTLAQVWDLETGNLLSKMAGHRTDLELTHSDGETYRTTAAF